MSAYTEFFLNSQATAKQLDLLEISHPNFSRSYFIVRNIKRNGVTVMLETAVSQAFEFYPLEIKPIGSNNSLDQVLQIQLGDVGELLASEMELVRLADGFATKPVVKYRTYRSDDLTAPLTGPFILEVTQIAMTEQGAAFEAAAPSINGNQTGEYYTLERFAMLHGFL